MFTNTVYNFCVFTSSLVIIAVISIIVDFKSNRFELQDSYDLVIAVLSARQNSERRKVIRNTWSSEKPGNVKLYFVIGSDSCPYSPDTRTDIHDCKLLQFNSSKIEKEASFTALKFSHTEEIVPLYNGFAFTVHHNIRIQRIGILASAFSLKGLFEIVLIQGSTKEPVVRSLINITNYKMYTEVNGYIYAVVDEFVYPKGFEGIIIVNSVDIPKISNKMDWDMAGGILSFKTYYNNGASEVINSELHRGASAVSFQFVVHQISSFKERMQTFQELQNNWNTSQLKLSKDLEAEQSKWNDIIFVQCIDTYRSLPQKLLLFYNWLTERSGINYKFLLKVDDDTVTIIEAILRRIPSLQQENIWWGKFRKNWPVNRFGKWSENEYTSSVYPKFACGAGYILSKDVVDWLARNYKKLHQYQGEDISLAIWLSAINPRYVEDSLWSCDAECVEGSYNRAELTVEEMKQTWDQYQKCGNLCHCH